jgi:DNA-binding GntR family transcriptional regulator
MDRMASDPEVLERRTIAETVKDRLRTEILGGRLQPGVPLRQNDIAKRYGVSTTPVREAFALLQAEGLVEIDRYRGAVVFRPSVDDVRDAYEIREALETLAVGKAATRISDDEAARLDALLAEMRDTTSVERWMQLNDEFHLGIYSASSSPRLLPVIASQRDGCSPYIRLNIEDPSTRRIKDEQHREILDACRARDIERAQKAIRVHLRQSMEEILELLGGDEDDDDAGNRLHNRI